MPSALLAFGPSLNPKGIKEGDDVYFECNVRANPRPYKVTWRFNVSIPSNEVFMLVQDRRVLEANMYIQ